MKIYTLKIMKIILRYTNLRIIPLTAPIRQHKISLRNNIKIKRKYFNFELLTFRKSCAACIGANRYGQF